MDPTTALFVRYRQHGDLEALGRVFDELAPRLLALAMHACGNAADAEDALQATFVVAMRKADAFDASAHVDGWLAGILGGEASNLRRRERRRRGGPFVEPAGADGDPVAASERAELVAALRTRVESLPEEQRQVLLLQLQHGLQPAAIAEVLGVPPGTVRMRLHRGMATLRGMLPAGLAALLAAMLPSRGIAAVRAAVMNEAVVVGGAVVLGGLMAKKAIAAVLLLVVLVAGGVSAGAIGFGNEASGAPALGGALASAANVQSDRPSVPDAPSDAHAIAEPAAREAVDVAPGSLRVVVRGAMGHRRGRMTVFSGVPGCGPGMADVFVQVWQGACDADSHDARTVAGRTDAGGVFEVPELAPGRWRIAITAGGARQALPEAVIASGKSTTVEQHVMLRAAVSGRVLDHTGQPVAGAEVWAGGRFGDAPPDRFVRRAAIARADGGFDCAVWSGELFVSARKSGYAASWSHPVDQLGDGPVTLVLGDDPGALVVRVVAADGTPIDRAAVCVQSVQESRRAADGTLLAPPLGQVANAVSPGRFVADGLAPGVYEVQGYAPGWRPSAWAKVIAGASPEVTFELRAGVTVRGHVRVRQGPLSGAYVELQRPGGGSRTTRTDDDGAFHFDGILPGVVTITALLRAGGSKAVADVRVTGDADVTCDLEVHDGVGLYGRVLDADGRPSPNRRVRVRQGDEREYTTGGDGTFWCDDLARTRTVLAVLEDGERPGALVERTLDDPDLDGAYEIVLPATAARTASIHVRVVDAVGTPVTGAFVRRKGAFAMPYPNVDGDGRIAFTELAGGEHRITIEAEGFAARTMPVAIAAHEMRDLGDVVLVRGCELRVQFLRPDGSPWQVRPPALTLSDADGKSLPANVLGAARRDVEANGIVVLRDLPAGRYTVSGPADDELLLEPRAVDLRADRAASLVVPVARGKRWTFVFATQHLPSSQPLVIQVRGRDGRQVATHETSTNGGFVEAKMALPLGELAVEAVCVGQRTHAGTCTIDDGPLPGRTTIDTATAK